MMYHRTLYLQATICVLALVIGPGCTSIKSTQLFRSSDGKFSAYCLPWATRGVPCKFKVESGVRATIEETILIDPENGQVLVPENRIYSVSLARVYADQVFMVHIPRPLAGTLDLTGNNGYHFNSDGYLTSIGAKIEDKTIEDITTALGSNSLGGFFKSSVVEAAKLLSQTRTIAVREFSYADPNWSVEMNEWVNQFQSCQVLCGPECQAEVVEMAPQVSSRSLRETY